MAEKTSDSSRSIIGRRGVGLSEVMVAASVLLILVGLQLVLIQGASSAFHKTNTQADLLQDMEITLARFTRDAQGSTLAGLSLNGNGVAFLSAHLAQQNLQLSPTGQPMWKQYLLYYFDAPSKELRWRALPMATPSETPLALDAYNFGSGPLPMATYQVSGKPLARFVDSFSVTAVNSEISTTLQCSRVRYGSPKPEKISMTQTVCMRN